LKGERAALRPDGRKIMRKGILPAAAVIALLLPAVVAGQDRGEIIDRVLAVVEDRAILQSEVEMEYRQHLFQNQVTSLPSDQEAQLRAQILEQLLADQLLAVHADKSGIEIPAQAVEDELEKAIEESRRSAGGDEIFERELEKAGLTLQQLRTQWKEKIRARYLVEQLLRSEVFKDMTVTDAEVRQYYREHLSELPRRPATMKLAHIVVMPGVADAASNSSLERIKSVEAEIRAGKDFAEAAEKYSEDPSATYGGSLGYIKLGDLGSPSFEETARKLIVGDVSPPVLTRYGWHLIKLEDVSGDQVKLRHILIKVESDEGQVEKAAGIAEKIRREILDGLDFGEAAAKYSADEKTKDNGGIIENEIVLESLVGKADYLLEILKETDVGGISPVVKEDAGFRIILVLEKNPSRPYTYHEAKMELENLLAQQKRMEKFQEYVHELKGIYYVDIKVGVETDVQHESTGG
jgi:peptidyl-prolyl cis-trans isomerase SurA